MLKRSYLLSLIEALTHFIIALHIDVVFALSLDVRSVHLHLYVLSLGFSKVFFTVSATHNQSSLRRRKLGISLTLTLIFTRFREKAMPAFFARAHLNRRHFSAGIKVFQTIIDDRTGSAIVLDGLVLLLTRVLGVKAEDALKIARYFRFADEHGRLLQSLSKPLTDSIIECILPSRRAKEVRASI